MTLQTSAPIARRTLPVSNRQAREIARLREYGLALDPPYQRGSVWTEGQQVALVRSWLAGVPVPAVTINDRRGGRFAEEDTYAVIDGKQRIETAIAWFEGDLGVPASWFEAEDVETTYSTDDGPYVRYSGLTAGGQRHVAFSAMLPVIEVSVGTVEEEAALYVLLERSGTPQTEEDVTRAVSVAEQSLRDGAADDACGFCREEDRYDEDEDDEQEQVYALMVHYLHDETVLYAITSDAEAAYAWANEMPYRDGIRSGDDWRSVVPHSLLTGHDVTQEV